ncbi:MAG: hypothetical protein KME15_27765 [Drouetiella hepatica Uher 2000/2452]|uniref:Uncharacterized protein n=1 Tax=Drouetiella hepatica Uher 2000/2452 TaxID=904376 RepID=A0A951QG61_9CYAN|nr:hypothetical protein [Drouetiella hepatica Uher 2000/2452]
MGGIKKDALALYLSSLGLAFKSARVITQEIETRDYDRLMRAATEPLRIENTRLSYDLGSQRSENAALKEADRLLWQRADEAEKVAARIRNEYKALENKLSKAIHATGQALKQVEAKEAELKELDLYNERMSVQLDTHRSVTDQKVNIQREETRKLEQNLKDAQKSFREKLEKAHADVDEARDALATSEAQVAVLRDEIARLHRAKTLAEGVDTNDFANRVVEWFGKAKFLVDAESANVSGSDWVLVFRLRNQKDSFRIREYAQQMKIDFSLSSLPTLKVDGDKLRITIHRGEIENEAKYLRVDPTWLQEALVFEKSGETVTHHARFSGSTETGKSTLVCNAVGVLIIRIPLVEIELADPLIAGQSEWKTLKPKYKGEDSCVAGFIRFYEEFKRLDRGEEKSNRSKVFIMDEFDRMMQNHPELLPMVLDLWKSGRHQKRYLWVLGQSALVGKFSLNMEDVQNVIGFYLGATVERGLTDANDDPSYSSKLRQEWHHAKARELRYLCLCRPMTVTGRPFLAVMPKPDTFALGKAQEALRSYDEGKEEVQLENRLVEFDLDSAKQNLERLVSPSQETQKDLTLGLTSKEKVKVEKLLREGLSASKVVKEVWGISPSRNEPYPTRKAQVECIKKTL